MDSWASAKRCSTSISNVAGAVAGDVTGEAADGTAGEIVGELARAVFAGDGWVRPAGTGFENFSSIGAGALAIEGSGAAGSVGVAAVLTATSPAGGNSAAALDRTPWGPNEMAQSPRMKSPANTKTPATDLSRICSSNFPAGSRECAAFGWGLEATVGPALPPAGKAGSFALVLLEGSRPSRNFWMSCTISLP